MPVFNNTKNDKACKEKQNGTYTQETGSQEGRVSEQAPMLELASKNIKAAVTSMFKEMKEA